MTALMLALGVGLSGLHSPRWDVRAECHALLCRCHPVSGPVAAGYASDDIEVRFRCAEIAAGRSPRVMPGKWDWPVRVMPGEVFK